MEYTIYGMDLNPNLPIISLNTNSLNAKRKRLLYWMAWVEMCPPQKLLILLGSKVFADDQVKLKSLERALIQYDWSPYKKGKFRHRDRLIQREDHVNTQGECHLRAKQRLRYQKLGKKAETDFSLTTLRRNQPRQPFDLGFLASRTVTQ